MNTANTSVNKQPSEAKAVMEIGKEYALSSLSVGDCVNLGGKICIVLGYNSSYCFLLYQSNIVMGYSRYTEVTYLGKGKVIIEFPKQYTLEDAANAFKQSLGTYFTYVYFIKLDNGKLIVYHSKQLPTCFTSSLGFPIDYVCVPDSKVLK